MSVRRCECTRPAGILISGGFAVVGSMHIRNRERAGPVDRPVRHRGGGIAELRFGRVAFGEAPRFMRESIAKAAVRPLPGYAVQPPLKKAHPLG